MNYKLAGKRALVTGSSAGLGEAIAKMLADEGVHVIVHGRNADRTTAVVTSIIESGGSAEAVLGDLSSDEGADMVANSALKSGPVDILVNNAGFYAHTGWSNTTCVDWMEVFNVNVVSYVRMIQRFVPDMKKQGWGRVINIGGGLGIQPINDLPHYNASLAARHNMSVSLARQLNGTGITSNVVAPGAIMNPGVEQWLRNAAPQRGWGTDLAAIERNAVKDIVPNDTNRFGRQEEVAAAVAYLASPYADYISGALLRVDGGTVRSI
ncbi:SDR family NAD(P)-dependent oxidoreductase [Chitinophaga ginsengisoli]|uniref:NAD(P)-dependent dehydrogenase (Short-subunit alcohol dehydrogenase family) n=1 Tax=Chitinophaga ginsengisoli TaxID=363837 RepID=A0A2P8GE12_9BACT|nr:SDR family NAD(P)-dependent oxidoreductase [Chitinophaga ginsengisoli]PSL32180.1 NAD(P)-dependent dehydrogenase (short-subunit alcohol dehydrogenase family) [Chitinophaga ginsengisoli]